MSQQDPFDLPDEADEFTRELEEMFSNPTPEKTEKWKKFTRSAAESYGPGEATYSLYCNSLISVLCDIQFEFGQNILDQLYDTGGIDYLDLFGAAQFLARGGDPAQIGSLAGEGQPMCL